jgi:alpha-ketoglutarate-dependent taurine dioxygenase
LQKVLVQRLGELSGKPKSSGLHIHPISNAGREGGGKDDEISVISSEQAKKLFKGTFYKEADLEKKQSGKDGWHSDITFEAVPSDYAVLRLTELPKTGGGMLSLSFVPHCPVHNSSTVSPNSGPDLIAHRHPLGIWLRTLRPHLHPLPEIP